MGRGPVVGVHAAGRERVAQRAVQGGMPYQIFVVEDHPMMRQAYADVLAREADLDLWGSAGSAEEALHAMESGRCDLMVVDISLPGMDGIELTARVRDRWPGLPVVIVSSHDEATYGDRARAAGAQAYLSKVGLATTLPSTLREVLGGRANGRATGPEPTPAPPGLH